MSPTPATCFSTPMRLSALVPSIPQEIVTLLKNNGIATDRDLLFHESAIDIYEKLPHDALTLPQLRAFIARVTELLSAPGICSADLPNALHSKLLTGVAELDALTDGFAGSQIVEISGDRGSGKTVSVLLRGKNKSNANKLKGVCLESGYPLSPGAVEQCRTMD